MIAFVKAIAERARVLKPGFLVVPQNAEALLADASYRAVIDGIGKEDLLFGDDVSQQPNDPKSIVSDVARLKLLTAERKPVFVVEYLDAPSHISPTARWIPCASATFLLSTKRPTRNRRCGNVA
jgi:uncharacterized protein (TIGR01370 family)